MREGPNPRDESTEYVVIRNGEVLARWIESPTSGTATAPTRRGLAMTALGAESMGGLPPLAAAPPVDMAAYEAALADKAIAQERGNLLTRSTREARARLAASWNWLTEKAMNNPLSRTLKRAGAWCGRMLMTFADKMGKRGMFFTGLAVLTSKTGQRALAGLFKAAVQVGKAAIDLLAWIVKLPLRLLPWTRPAAEAVDRAKRWLYTKLTAGWNSPPVQGTLALLSYDGPVGIIVQSIARPLAVIKLITVFVPGAWKLLALLVAIPFLLPRPVRQEIGSTVSRYMEALGGDNPDTVDMLNPEEEEHVEKARKTFRQQAKDVWAEATAKPFYENPALTPLIDDITNKMLHYVLVAPNRATRGNIQEAAKDAASEWNGVVNGRGNVDEVIRSFGEKVGVLFGEKTPPFDNRTEENREELAKAIRGQVVAALQEIKS